MSRLYLVFILLIVSSCGANSEEGDKRTEVLLVAGNKFEIPKQFILPSLPSSLVGEDGLDEEQNSISLRLKVSEFGLNLDDGKDVVILFGESSEFFNENRINIDAYNAWFGLESYQNRVIEWDEKKGLFKVGSKAGFPMFWHYFSKSPKDEREAFQAAYYASCYEALEGQPTCSTEVYFEGSLSKITLSGDLIFSMNEVRDSYIQLLKSWSK